MSLLRPNLSGFAAPCRRDLVVVLLVMVGCVMGCRSKSPYDEYVEQQQSKWVVRTERPEPVAPTTPNSPTTPSQPTQPPTATSADPVDMQVYAVKNRVQILLTNKTGGPLSVSAYSFGVIQGRTLTKFNPTYVTNEFPVSSLPPQGQSVGFLTFRALGNLVGSKFVFYHPDYKPVAVTIQAMPAESPAFPIVIPPGESKIR